MQIIWKPQAEKDLEAIEEFYLKTAPEFADIFVKEIHYRTKRLEHSPRSGRMVPEVNDPAIREILYRNYRIIYLILADSGPAEILTIFHSSKQFGPLPE